MFIKQFYDEGLAHLSYMIGDEKEAFVIDPHQDVEDYLEFAQNKGVKISHIFETHRNEDYVIGSRSLAAFTNAPIYHGKHLAFNYGNSVSEGDEFQIEKLKIKILETPGHTPESISVVLYNLESVSNTPLAVFTGDALFVGAVGRTDLWKTREIAAGILYDSIYNKILPLGDHVLLYPAHGAGSVCGEGMGSSNFSTLGYEKKYNQGLQSKSKADFIQKQEVREFEKPPYFKEMERRNQECPDAIKQLPIPNIVTVEQVQKTKVQIVDVRSPEAFASVAVPGSISLPLKVLSRFAGWFLNYDLPILLIAEQKNTMEEAVKRLTRLGYQNFKGWLSGVHDWEISGYPYWHIPAVHAEEVKTRIEQHQPFLLLDVRSDSEWQSGHLPGAKHLYLGNLMKHLNEIPKDCIITTFCGSGQRAVIGASLLKQNGFTKVEVCLGSMLACQAIGCPIEKEQ